MNDGAMQSTKANSASCVYLGVDVTDRFSKEARPMDVCGLEIKDENLVAHFWTWRWGRTDPVGVSAILPEIHKARAVMIDGPQGLAKKGRSIRSSERALAAAGKTGATRPPLPQPYGGFIGSSLDLFAAFHATGLTISPTSLLGLCEVYPAAIWKRLARGLSNKRTLAGREARTAILQALGVALPAATCTHDQLDACVSAVIGAAGDRRIPGMTVAAVGDAVLWDATSRCLREGTILVPFVDASLRERLDAAIQPWASVPSAEPRRIVRPSTEGTTKPFGTGRMVARPVLTGTTRDERAVELFEQLVSELIEGRPTLCTYKAAVAAILGFANYTPAYGSQLTKLASRTGVFEAGGLGVISLDTFLVNQSHRPGEKHWDSATYAESDWDRVFSSAVVIE